jgi:hypothetical protein
VIVLSPCLALGCLKGQVRGPLSFCPLGPEA